MKMLRLTRGLWATVSDIDHVWAQQWKWHAQKWGHGFCAARTARKIYLHREIAARKGITALRVDHKDGNSLNNARSNLRAASHAQNMRNRTKHAKTSSRFKGVCWDKQHSKWRARIRVDRVLIHLGLFTSEERAARAYDRAARKFHRSFAKLNF